MSLRPEEVESSTQLHAYQLSDSACIVPYADVRAAMIYINHAREKIGTWCVHREGHVGSGIVTIIFPRSL